MGSRSPDFEFQIPNSEGRMVERSQPKNSERTEATERTEPARITVRTEATEATEKTGVKKSEAGSQLTYQRPLAFSFRVGAPIPTSQGLCP
jgi:hypothetical protein